MTYVKNLSDLDRAYRQELAIKKMPSHVRAGVFAVGVINTAFIWLDWYAFPSLWWQFFPVRIVLNLTLVPCFALADRIPMATARALAIATGLMLTTVIVGTGADTTPYYAGLLLFLTAMPVLLPLAPSEAAAIGLPFFALYLFAAFGGEGSGDRERSVVHALFLAGGMLTGIAHARLADKNRFHDFQRRKEIEKARDELAQLDEQKSRFTANVHHELRTPLTLTLAPLEGLLSGELGEVPDSLRGYLKIMHSNGLRLLKLINNLLDLAKAEGSQLTLRKHTLPMQKICEAVVEDAKLLALRKNVTLSCRFEDDLPPVNVDRDAIEKVLINLVGNALKFTRAGDSIYVDVGRSGAEVHTAVTDTGVGVAADQLDRIFDRFAQVDASSTREYEGTGIGLSLVKELVELHGGTVWATSDGVGQGTTVHFCVPVSESSIGESGECQKNEGDWDVESGPKIDAQSRSDSSYRMSEIEENVRRYEAESPEGVGEQSPEFGSDAPEIVVVDDNADMRSLLANLLAKTYRVRLAKNGREALELIGERRPDCVITDVMMPVMSGTELCRAVKSRPETEAIPVVLVTSRAERDMKVKGLELGADDYVTKPFHPRELLARIRGIVRLRRLQVEIEEKNLRLETALLELRETEVQLVQAERLAAVGELAAGVAHEANNPLNFSLNAISTLSAFVHDIRGIVALMNEIDFDDPPQFRDRVGRLRQLQEKQDFPGIVEDIDEIVKIVTEGLERTQRLVADLRDFAAPGRRVEVPVDIVGCLTSTLALLQRGGLSNRIQVETHFERDLPPVQGDAGALNQVFLNILKNAADAIGNRDGVIRVESRKEGSAVVVEVHDNGPGVEPGIRERLFEPFVTSKDAGKGSGLGLSICRRIIDAHGGRIGLESDQSFGTRVRIEFVQDGDECRCH